MVGMTRFELATFRSRTERATELRYIPTQRLNIFRADFLSIVVK